MDTLTIELNRLYDEMNDELYSEIEALGGKVVEFSPENQIVNIAVDPSLREHVEGLVSEIIKKYLIKKKELYKSDSFHGIKQLLNDD